MNKRHRETFKNSILTTNYTPIYYDLDEYTMYDNSKLWTDQFRLTPIDIFINSNLQLRDCGKNDIRSSTYNRSLNNFICNLVYAYETQKPIALRRNKAEYSNSSFYKVPHYTYTNITDALIRSTDQGYVEIKRGYFDRELKKGKITRLLPTEKLIKEIQNCISVSQEINTNYKDLINKIYFPPASYYFKKANYYKPLILKDTKKNKITYKPTIENKKMEKFLLTYNDFIKKIKIQVPKYYSDKYHSYYNYITNNISSSIQSNHIFPLLGQNDYNYCIYKDLECRLYRVFNNRRFDEGGRFYGADYQRLSEVERSKISINENPTTEIDFFSLHGKMIYHLFKNKDYLDDPYMIDENIELRDAAKKMFQMMLNAKGKIEAIKAFKKFLREDIIGDDVTKALIKFGYSPDMLYQALEKKHIEVKEYFGKGIGLKLQYIDSTIAESILKHFMKLVIPSLCVHDSFIVEKQFEGELEETMKREYRRVIGFECKLKTTKAVK